MDSDEKKDRDTENTQEHNERDSARERFKDPQNIEELRARLYERGSKSQRMGRTDLKNIQKGTEREVRHNWNGDIAKKPLERQGRIEDAPPEAPKKDIRRHIKRAASFLGTTFKKTSGKSIEPAASSIDETMPRTSKRKAYRKKFVLAGFIFFIGALLISTVFLRWGGNTISGENISIDISPRPFTIGGGEELAFQVAVANQNSVPIESATLIVNYPSGTQSADEAGKELFSERQQLNNIATGEVINIPLKAIIFGEENQEKTIEVAVEYRVRGSNAIFFKEADPLILKISSSPAVLRVDAVDSISSGQEIEFDLTVSSNSPTPLSDILVKASYPFGFDFTKSDPETYAGQDTWRIESLDPEEEETITIRGIVTGKQDEVRNFVFSVGVPNERDRFNLASTFSTVNTEVGIEDPFLDVAVDVNGNPSEQVVIALTESATVNVRLRNALEETIYDGEVIATLRGDAYNEMLVVANDGHYDSETKTITWDSVDVEVLEEIPPGQTGLVQFQLQPLENISRTPEVILDITARAKRIFADRVPQELEGTASRTIRVESFIALTSSALYSTGPFQNTGPMPPIAGEVTQYTLSFTIQNGSNDITGAEMTAVLPQYITWLDLKTSGDAITYDPNTRTIFWDIGDMGARSTEEASVQVSFKPSLSQVNSIPTLLESQRFRATDRFTGTTLRASAPALTTSLFTDPDKDTHDGRVEQN